LSSRKTLLKRGVLGSPGLVEDQPAEEARTRACRSTEAGVSADGAGDRTDAGAAHCAGERALLGWGHVGASSGRQSEGRKQQYLLHVITRER